MAHFRCGTKIWDSVFSRPWWRRVWTLQEGLAASVRSGSLVLCGNKSVSWRNLRETRRTWLQRLSPRRRLAVDDFLASCSWYQESLRRATIRQYGLEEMFWASIRQDASSPYDNVFALLGPLAETHEHSFEPDYTNPLTYFFQQAMVSIIAPASNLDFLLVAARQGLDTESSWCLDFRLRHGRERWRDRIVDIDIHCLTLSRDCREIVRTFYKANHHLSNGTITLSGKAPGSVTTTVHVIPNDGDRRGIFGNWDSSDWPNSLE